MSHALSPQSDTIDRQPLFAVPRSITGAMIWRTLKQSLYEIPLSLVVTCVMPFFIYQMVAIERDGSLLSATQEDLTHVQRVFFVLEMAIYPIFAMICSGRIRPLYTRPITTGRIVNTQLAVAVWWAIILHLVTVVFYWLAMNIALPVWGPLAFLVLLVPVMAGLWAIIVEMSWWRVVVFLAGSVLLGWGLVMRFENKAILSRPAGWITPTSQEAIILACLAVAGYGLTRWMVDRSRQGEIRSWQDLDEVLLNAISGLGRLCSRLVPQRVLRRRDSSRPANPFVAQASYDWSLRGVAVPLLTGCFGLLSMIAAYHDPQDWLKSAVNGFPVLLIMTGLITGLITGFINSEAPYNEMDRFRATRPLSDTQLAYSALLNGLRSIGAALLIGLGLTVIVMMWTKVSGGRPFSVINSAVNQSPAKWGLPESSYSWELVRATVAAWVVMGLLCTIMLTGRYVIIVAIYFGWLFVVIPGNALISNWLSAEQAAAFWRLSLLLLLVALATLTLWSFHRAQQKNLLEGWAIPLGIVGWGLGCVMSASWITQHAEGAIVAPLIVAAGVLVSLPIAASPLAVQWNRHR